ncbi:MAG: hypothetical protein ACYDDO_04370 [Acidiferrobacterales bacterium]
MNVEDWSAYKAVVCASLAAVEELRMDWPMWLIQGGRYRVMISAAQGTALPVYASPFVNFIYG